MDFLNPVTWARAFAKLLGLALSGTLQKKVTDMTNFFEDLLVHPIRPPEGELTDWLYGNALGLAGNLAISMVIIGFLLAIFSRQIAIRASHALLIALIALPLFQLFFALCDGLIEASSTLTAAILKANELAGGGKLIAPPSISDLFWGSIGVLGIGISGTPLTIILAVFALLIIVVKFAFLPCLVLDPWGGRGALRWCISGGLVFMFLSRPTAALCIVLGKTIGYQTHNVALTVIGTIAGIIVAIIAQFKLIKKTNQVVGNVLSKARTRIDGRVETYNKPMNRTTMQNVQNVHMAGMRSSPRMTRGQALGLAVRQQRHARSVAKTTAMISTTSNPTLKAAYVIMLRAKKNRPPVAHSPWIPRRR